MNCLCDNIHCDYLQKLGMDEISKSQKIILTSCNADLSVNDFVHIFMTGIRMINIDLLFDFKEDLLRMLMNINEAIRIFDEKFEFNEPITKICTLRGRTSRMGRMRNDQCWRLNSGDLIVLTCNEIYKHCSTNEICFVTNFTRIIPMLEICDMIEIKGRNIEMQFQVVKIVDDCITCCVSKSGIIESHQKLSFPQFQELYHELIDEEIEDCKFAVENNFDFIIVPDVRHARYYHHLKKAVKESGIKLIAKIESELDTDVIDKIVKHFFATISTLGSNFDVILQRSISAKKPIIARFPKEQNLSRNSIRICESVDAYIIKCNGIKELVKTVKKFNKISEDIIKYSALNKQQENLDGSVKLDVDKTNYTYTNAKKVESQVKALVCITHSGRAIRDMAGYDNYRYILALTKDRTLAKRLHLLRNVLPMVYIKCGIKNEEQLDELMMIALKFGKAMKIIVSEDPVIERLK